MSLKKRNKKIEGESEFLVNVSFERFTDKILSELSPEKYAKILEKNLRKDTKKRVKKTEKGG